MSRGQVNFITYSIMVRVDMPVGAVYKNYYKSNYYKSARLWFQPQVYYDKGLKDFI